MATAACGEGGYSPFYRIEVDVEGNGAGSGTVEASDEAVGLNCTITAGSESAGCQHTFDDAGGGGTFTLTAIPGGGSVFTSWSGCTSVAGPVCTLTFGASAGDTTLAPEVTFALGESNTVTLYNGASVSASHAGAGRDGGGGQRADAECHARGGGVECDRHRDRVSGSGGGQPGGTDHVHGDRSGMGGGWAAPGGPVQWGRILDALQQLLAGEDEGVLAEGVGADAASTPRALRREEAGIGKGEQVFR